jgi:hypothetical protein
VPHGDCLGESGSLHRGAAVHWYPYPFLNPTHSGGYARVALYAVVLALFMGLLALAVNALGRRTDP